MCSSWRTSSIREARSRIFRFVDDLEILATEGTDAEPSSLAIRSASRVGYSDRGVNRRRVRTLVAQLIDEGVVEA